MNAKAFVFLMIALAVISGGGIVVATKPRGIRNNNPGNIRKNNIEWQGMSAEQLDPEFVQFIAPEYGFRAMAKLLRGYQSKYGLKTIRELVNRWAPTIENNTSAYVDSVAKETGINADMPISVDAHLPELLRAITRHENGIAWAMYYTDETITKGIALA